ncbi:MAG TPA: hypothetical protein VF846_08135 [Thermoanaerobaculia bacterium]|jgi:hypothetical protein
MRDTAFIVVVTVAVAALLAALAIGGTGSYGLALFMGVPVFIGYATTALIALRGPRRFWFCFRAAVLAALVLSTGFLLVGVEGFICILTMIPLSLPFIALGSALAWELFHRKQLARAGVTTLLLACLLATAIAIEPGLHGPRTVFLAADAVEIDGTPEEIWNAIVALDEVPPPDDVFFRAGIATPQKTKIQTCATGGLRVCTLSTGTLVERIDVWEPGKRLGWRALSTPPPMKELNPFHDEVDPPHLHGMYRNVRGEFALEPIDASRTRVWRRTWYEHDLYPAAYWRIWCDLGAWKIHHLVLEHVRSETVRRRGGKAI